MYMCVVAVYRQMAGDILTKLVTA